MSRPLVFTIIGVLALAGLTLALTSMKDAPEAETTEEPAPAAPASPVASPPVERASGEFPETYYYPGRDGTRHPKPARLEGKVAPRLVLDQWVGTPQDLANLKGKVVVVDFWATWCRPCLDAIPKNIAMVEELGPRGLVLIGVHDGRRGVDRMPGMITSTGINYPVGVDSSGQTVRSYELAFWPTYVVIDHTGTVRAAGLRPTAVGPVVTKLLAEKEAAETSGKVG